MDREKKERKKKGIGKNRDPIKRRIFQVTSKHYERGQNPKILTCSIQFAFPPLRGEITISDTILNLGKGLPRIVRSRHSTRCQCVRRIPASSRDKGPENKKGQKEKDRRQWRRVTAQKTGKGRTEIVKRTERKGAKRVTNVPNTLDLSPFRTLCLNACDPIICTNVSNRCPVTGALHTHPSKEKSRGLYRR